MVKQGYKQTEIGIIPEDWDLITYDEAFIFLSTATYSRSQLSENENVKYIHYGDIHTKFKHYLDLIKSLPTVSNDLSKRYSFIENGDIVMADASEDYEGVGKSVEVINEGNIRAISGLHTFLFRDKANNFQNGYKAYISENRLVKKSFSRLTTGMKVYGVSKTNLKTILIPKPNLTEQKAIATTLTDINNLITNLETLITKKKAIKQGAMQQLLTGKKRLKGFTGNWGVKKLPELIWYQEGPGLRNWQFTNKGIKVINVTNLVNGYLDLTKTSRYISLSEFNKMYKHFEIDLGDVVMASSGNSYSKTSIVRENDLPLLMNTSVIRFKPKENYDKTFMYIYLKSYLFKDQIDFLITGGAQPNFGPFHLKKIDLPYPAIEEQQAIALILGDMDTEIETLEQQKSKTQNLKQGMMQELLTGKTRLV